MHLYSVVVPKCKLSPFGLPRAKIEVEEKVGQSMSSPLYNIRARVNHMSGKLVGKYTNFCLLQIKAKSGFMVGV